MSQAMYFTGNVFQMLGVPAMLGRYLLPSDAPDEKDTQPVIVLNYKFRMRHYNGDRSIVGKTIQLVHKTYIVIGVMPPHFGFLPAEQESAQPVTRSLLISTTFCLKT